MLMAKLPDPRKLLAETFGAGGEDAPVSAPGRVNLIGEHIDYHGLPVLPMAIRRSVRWRSARARIGIRVVSAGYGTRDFDWTRISRLPPRAIGKTICAPPPAQSAGNGAPARSGRRHRSDLPPAAGLSSSSALLVAFTLSLLRANAAAPVFAELMEFCRKASNS
jgi:galactokinase